MNRPRSETIVFNGIKFRRYPDSKNLNDRNYYRPSSNYIKRGVGHLHREIWKATYGDIPDGYDIHHKDENPLNNSIDNLECLSKSEHAELHAQSMPEWKREWVRGQLNTHARPKAIDWHKSDEGREFHKLLGKWSWEDRDQVEKVCEHCGKQYSVVDISAHHSRYCSNACKSYARVASGIDNETRICEWCHIEFICNKYERKRYCGRSCASLHREHKKKH